MGLTDGQATRQASNSSQEVGSVVKVMRGAVGRVHGAGGAARVPGHRGIALGGARTDEISSKPLKVSAVAAVKAK